jgi:hypothetical protein
MDGVDCSPIPKRQKLAVSAKSKENEADEAAKGNGKREVEDCEGAVPAFADVAGRWTPLAAEEIRSSPVHAGAWDQQEVKCWHGT